MDVTLATMAEFITKRLKMSSKISAETGAQAWLLLIHQLPSRPTNLRVRVWRKLQKLGAVAIKNSIYVLPANEKTQEDFQWLKQEIESAGGEVSVFRADSVEGATDDEIIEAFRTARNAEFSSVTAELEGLAGAIREQARGKHLSAGRLASHEAELNKIHAELERIAANDFFSASRRADALKAYERCQSAIRSSQSPAKEVSASRANRVALDPAKYQGKRWVTRRNLHIDRLTSAWLIKQFIDKRPRFYFVAEGEALEGAIPFDMYGAEFSHQGEDCTFETLLKQFDLGHVTGLRELAEIVHDIDLKDDKFHRLEAAGLNLVVNGLSQVLRDDRKLLQAASVIFDGLFLLLEERANTSQKKKARPDKRRKKSSRSKRN